MMAIKLFGIKDDYEARRSARLFLKYGITPEEEAKMLVDQKGACATCEEKPDLQRLVIDFCEDTATIRGLLCPGCRTTIRRAGSNLLVWQRTMAYLLASRLASYTGFAGNSKV